MRLKPIILTLCVLGCLFGCQSKPLSLSFDVPPALCFEEKIYWQTESEPVVENQMPIATVEAVSPDFPDQNKTVNPSGQNWVDAAIYRDGDDLILEHENNTARFEYRNAPTKQERVLKDFDETGEIAPPGMALPHFVYEDMAYFLLGKASAGEAALLEPAGTIRKVCEIAGENFDGVGHVGDELYASPTQNRYMILHDIQNDTYAWYENENYFY